MNTEIPTSSKESKLTLLERIFQKERLALEATQAELERKTQEARQLQEKLQSLNVEVENCSKALEFADAQFRAFDAERTRLRKLMLTAWGNSQLPGGPNYRLLIEVNAAMTDYPRVRAYLEAKLRQATEALAEFERKLDLN